MATKKETETKEKTTKKRTTKATGEKETAAKAEKVVKKRKEITVEVKRALGVLSTGNKGWQRELNIVSWNGGRPKIDIRDWAPDHEKAGKGIALTAEEVALLKTLLEDYDPYEAEEL